MLGIPRRYSHFVYRIYSVGIDLWDRGGNRQFSTRGVG